MVHFFLGNAVTWRWHGPLPETQILEQWTSKKEFLGLLDMLPEDITKLIDVRPFIHCHNV